MHFGGVLRGKGERFFFCEGTIWAWIIVETIIGDDWIDFLGRLLDFCLRFTSFSPSKIDGYLSQSWAGHQNRRKLPFSLCKKGRGPPEQLWFSSVFPPILLELRVSSSNFCGKMKTMHKNVKRHKTTIHESLNKLTWVFLCNFRKLSLLYCIFPYNKQL